MTDAELAAARLIALLDAEREIERLRAQRILSNEDFARAFDMGLAAGERRATVAEVERLRGEVSYLRARVPPTRPTDYGHEVWTAALRAEVAAERTAVVAWLRSQAESTNYRPHTCPLADAIERGEHRREEGG